MAPMFPSRQERLDWQLIAELEPVVLVAGRCWCLSAGSVGLVCLVGLVGMVWS